MPFSRKVIRGLTVSTTDSCLVFPEGSNIYVQQGQVHFQRNKIFMLYSSELAFSDQPRITTKAETWCKIDKLIQFSYIQSNSELLSSENDDGGL